MRLHSISKNTKALSPVIATIILVAVTVAIAIAVAAWLGALTFTYTRTEQITITALSMSTATSGATQGQVTFTLSNSGTSDVTISSATANGGAINNVASTVFGGTCTSGLVPKGTSCTLIVTFTSQTFVSGTRYDFNIISSQGNKFPTSGIA